MGIEHNLLHEIILSRFSFGFLRDGQNWYRSKTQSAKKLNFAKQFIASLRLLF